MTFPFVDSPPAEAPKLRSTEARRSWKVSLRADGDYFETEVIVAAHWMQVQGGMVCFFDEHPDKSKADILVVAHSVDLVAQFSEVVA